MAVPNLSDAEMRYFQSKIPDTSIKPSVMSQILLAAGSTLATTGVQNQGTLGTPDTITVFLRSGTAGTVQFSLSQDGNDWYHDTSYDVVISSPPVEKVVKIPGAPYIKVTPSVTMSTAAVRIQCNYA